MILVMSRLIGEGMEEVTEVTHPILPESCFKNTLSYQKQKITSTSFHYNLEHKKSKCIKKIPANAQEPHPLSPSIHPSLESRFFPQHGPIISCVIYRVLCGFLNPKGVTNVDRTLGVEF